MTIIEKIREGIDTRFKEARLENTRFYYDVLDIIDKYAEKPMKESLNGVFLELSELGIQDIVCAEEIYRLIHITYEIGFNTGFNEAKAEQEPCEDCDYSEIMDWEQDAKTGKAKPIYWCERHKEPCEDAVSRQAVDDYIVKLLDGYLYDEERTRFENLCAYLWELPSVRPQEPKTGHWDFFCQHWRKCSECGFSHKFAEDWNYCPNCGARMVEQRENEDNSN